MADDAPPPAEPLALAEVKRNLRLDAGPGAEDELLEALIEAAREYVEGQTGLVLTPRVLTETAMSLGNWIELAAWPVTAVLEVRSPLAGVATALPAAAWQTSVKRRPVRVLPVVTGWGVAPAYGSAQLPIEIDIDAGYRTPGDVPRAIRQAMQLLVAHWYSNRDAAEVGARAAAIEIPLGVADLLRPFRLLKV